MSRTGKKRVVSTDAGDISQKRRRLGAGPKRPAKTKLPPGASVATLTADELPWREVSPPQQLGDAEGFFGLEEIEHVDVVREGAGKQARFRVCFSIYVISIILMGPFSPDL